MEDCSLEDRGTGVRQGFFQCTQEDIPSNFVSSSPNPNPETPRTPNHRKRSRHTVLSLKHHLLFRYVPKKCCHCIRASRNFFRYGSLFLSQTLCVRLYSLSLCYLSNLDRGSFFLVKWVFSFLHFIISNAGISFSCSFVLTCTFITQKNPQLPYHMMLKPDKPQISLLCGTLLVPTSQFWDVFSAGWSWQNVPNHEFWTLCWGWGWG